MVYLTEGTTYVWVHLMYVLIILASMGVSIGPLIACAGMIGLAIGFGALTLVKDIITGVFFSNRRCLSSSASIHMQTMTL